MCNSHVQENPGERTWQLTADSAEEATRWAGLLREHIALRYPEGELPPSARDDDEDEEELSGLGKWLGKKGEGLGVLTGEKKRFFVLMWGRQTQQLKLCYYAKLQHGLPVNRKGFVVVTPATLVQSQGKTITLVGSTTIVPPPATTPSIPFPFIQSFSFCTFV
jgi:hypothetical protein